MLEPSLSAEQQKELAQKLTCFLSRYRHLSDSYIIEFFTEDLWHTLPSSWQLVLQDLSYPQIADLLLDATHGDRRYPAVWPLSLLAFCATAHALAFPRESRRDQGRGGASVKPVEFQENQSQSSLLGHIFRKHVKPKKQHEIRKLGMLVKQLCDQTDCDQVVDVGSGQGHLTRFLSFGLGLCVTAVEADRTLVEMASRFDRELLWVLEKDKKKQSSSSQLPVSQSSPRHVAGWVNPKASWEAFIKQLSVASCVSEAPLTPSGPSKKRLRGCEHCVVQTSLSHGSSDSDAGPPQRPTTDQPARQGGAHCEDTSLWDHTGFVLTGLHACGDLSATLLRHFVNCPHVRGITSVACCYMKITTKENPTPPGLVEPPAPLAPVQELVHAEFGYPMSSRVRGLPGHQLSYKAREGACHAVEDYIRRLREDSELLRTHCYRAMLETFIRDIRPDLRRAGIQTIKKSHLLPFTEYARLGLARVGLPPELPLDLQQVEVLLLAPVVETLVLLDRMMYLQENGVTSQLVPLFNPNFSPRNFVLVALKPRG
ncbi:methyltransferase-like protein 25B isoform X2 [Mastacembelus armatus]|uniref:methyltransferase-like protein 25B isoform X2 n=1 Tax=Mastacembelus armatus TaxID=205130 RepID=UPI000E463781|nr:protein RRNAD1 isoform X2 [Mastacembelus armatus]